MKFTLKGLFVLVATFAFVVWLIQGFYFVLTHVEFGENVPAVAWLPETATNVSFYKSYPVTCYEFDIPEADFVKWSRQKLSPITDPVRVMRYSYMQSRVPAPGTNATQEAWQAYEDANFATITEGLYYGYTQSNGGGVWMAYDRTGGRAFFRSSPR